MTLTDREQKLGELLARLRDGLQGLQPAIGAIDEYLNFLGQKMEEKRPWDASRIRWVQDHGSSGPYERYPAQGTKAESTDDYRNMVEDLKAHSGKLSRAGMFYWLFQDSATVGRKAQGKKEAEKAAGSKQAANLDVGAVKSNFPQDLQQILSFEAEGKFVIIKPRQFLGSDNFSKIASIVRGAGGEYISAGKQSHFKVPVGA